MELVASLLRIAFGLDGLLTMMVMAGWTWMSLGGLMELNGFSSSNYLWFGRSWLFHWRGVHTKVFRSCSYST